MVSIPSKDEETDVQRLKDLPKDPLPQSSRVEISPGTCAHLPCFTRRTCLLSKRTRESEVKKIVIIIVGGRDIDFTGHFH